MKNIIKFTTLVLLALSLNALANQKIKIVATTSDLASIAKAITGDIAEIDCIANGSQDPHFIAARPGYIVQARDADVWIRIGLELEIGWEPPILRDSRNNKIQIGTPGHIDASVGIIKLEVPDTKVTRDMGDVHPYGNPHYWLDPLNGRIVARTIAKRLTELYPENTEIFNTNLKTFELELDNKMFGNELVNKYGGAKLWRLMLEKKLTDVLTADNTTNLIGGWYGKLLPFAGQMLITYHKSWIYLTERFGLKTAIELEPKPGIPPTARHLQLVVKTIVNNKIKVILQEQFYSEKAADFIVEKTGAKLIVCPNSVNSGNNTDSYINMIDYVINQLAENL